MSEKKFKAKNLLDAVSSEHETSTLNNQESLSNYDNDEEPIDEATMEIIRKTQDFITQLDKPRITSCSVFPYTLDENSEMAILFRCMKIQAKQNGMYAGFGSSIKENEPNILFSAARSLVNKSAGLCLPSELTSLAIPREIKRIVQDQLVKNNQFNIFQNRKVKEILQVFNNTKNATQMEVIAENHLTIFYPMPFFRVEPVNLAFRENCEGTKYQDLSFHWIPLSQILNPDFMNIYISGFNLQLIMYMAERVVNNVFITENRILKMEFYPKIAVMNVDNQPHLETVYESMIIGQYMGGMGGSDVEQWGVYNVYDFHLPSESELAEMKAIIIPGAATSVYDLEQTPWLPVLTRLIQNVYENYPQIKLIGICFGSQIIAQALGGQVEKMPMFNQVSSNQLQIFIGKETIDLREEFFEELFVQSVINHFVQTSEDPQKYLEQLKIELGSLIVHAVHGDHVASLPHNAVNLGYSDRTENEIWKIGDRVLCMQSHPEFNASYIEELIVNKMYDNGRLDDMQKDEVLERVNDNEQYLTRNVLNMFIYKFIYQ